MKAAHGLSSTCPRGSRLWNWTTPLRVESGQAGNPHLHRHQPLGHRIARAESDAPLNLSQLVSTNRKFPTTLQGASPIRRLIQNDDVAVLYDGSFKDLGHDGFSPQQPQPEHDPYSSADFSDLADDQHSSEGNGTSAKESAVAVSLINKASYEVSIGFYIQRSWCERHSQMQPLHPLHHTCIYSTQLRNMFHCSIQK